MNVTHFKVSHLNNASLGIAVLRDSKVTYKTDKSAYAWFEARDDAWLSEFRKIVRQLCKSVGHAGKYSSSRDIDSGIEVSRV